VGVLTGAKARPRNVGWAPKLIGTPALHEGGEFALFRFACFRYKPPLIPNIDAPWLRLAGIV